jgi:hypothetical protein
MVLPATKRWSQEFLPGSTQDRNLRLGIIDSLSAGYRFLGRRIEIVLIPILLDILLWLGPQFSVAPLFDQVARFYATAASAPELPPDTGVMAEQVAEMLALLGERINLLELLVNTTLLHVPGLIATLGPLDSQAVATISSWAQAFSLFVGLGLAGLLIGVTYLNLLALYLPIGQGQKPSGVQQFLETVLRHWLTVLLYIVVMIVVLVAAAVPMSILVGILTVISPAIGALTMPIFGGLALLVFFYLYFVAAALVLDDLPVHRAMLQSFRLVRNNFWATLGFVILTNVIAIGITMILNRLAEFEPVGVLVAVGVNAYIGSGLAMAFLVFYRTRILRAAGEEVDVLLKDEG